ncbi:MAG: hypothetical protein GWN62_25685 [Aliifodinibius sp.]|nr:hypothetical protein [Fodinibius sp.]
MTEPYFFAIRNSGDIAHCYDIRGKIILGFNLRALTGCGMRTAKDIVYHEMIHQYVDYHLNVEDNDHHGWEFWTYYFEFSLPGDTLGEVII